MTKQFRLVMIKWVDSRQPTSSWQWLSKHEGTPVSCTTVGWLIKDSDEAMSICQSFGDIDASDGDIQTMGVTLIPTRAIIDIVDLHESVKEAAE